MKSDLDLHLPKEELVLFLLGVSSEVIPILGFRSTPSEFVARHLLARQHREFDARSVPDPDR